MGSKKEKKDKVVVGNVSIRTADGSMIRGKINLGDNERISDVLVKGDSPYLVVFDATTSSVEAEPLFIRVRSAPRKPSWRTAFNCGLKPS